MSNVRDFTALGAGALAAALGAAPLAADRVVLSNGRVFEDVAAEVRGETVVVEVGGGVLTLPRSKVLAVESGPSTLAEYRRRADALRDNAAATAQDWLALARWAGANDCDFGAREAALEAAARAPGLAGLEVLLRGLGYEQAEPGGAWLPYEQAMRERGWVEDGAEWVPAEVAAARAEARRQASEAQRRAAEAARLEQLTALAEARLAADLARPEPWVVDWPYWGYPAWGSPVGVPQPGRPGHGLRPDRPSAPPQIPAPRGTGQSTTNSVRLGGSGPAAGPPRR